MKKKPIFTSLALLLAAGMPAMAVSPRALSQFVNLELVHSKTTVGTIIQSISQQTGYEFSYDVSILNKEISDVSVNVKNERIENVLDQVFNGTGISYRIVNNRIFLKDNVYIVIVPRDINRGEDIQNTASKLGYNLPLYTDYENSSEDGIIIDTIGELLNWYKLSDLVIMGGTFIGNVGGHNILEAIYFKKPVIVGKYMYNFIEIYEYMKDAVFTCEDKNKLHETIELAYKNKELRDELSEKAYNLLRQNNGASQRTISIINKYQGIV